MFRPMRRFKQQLTAERCEAILAGGSYGVLSLLGDEGYPYGLPIDHWYCEEDGNLYFHSGMTGHKVDAMKKHNIPVTYLELPSGGHGFGAGLDPEWKMWQDACEKWLIENRFGTRKQ